MRPLVTSFLISALSVAGLSLADGVPVSKVASEALGKGVQIYNCKASSSNFSWVLKAPDATLTDASGHVVGKHFAGPTWQANDGSLVVGEPVNVSASPTQGAIAWIVLHAKSHAGSGQMSDVEYIVRTHTAGGMAPLTGCDASHVGAEVRVPYSATYLFFRH